MKKISPYVLAYAYKRGGYRERFAITHGKAHRKSAGGEDLIVFVYSRDIDYQDANGATYSITRRAWIG